MFLLNHPFNIGQTRLTSQQVDALFIAISRGYRLNCLNISSNNLSLVHSALLASAVNKLKTLNMWNTRLIDMSTCQIEAVLTAITGNTQFNSLNIGGIDLSSVEPSLLARHINPVVSRYRC